MKHLKIKSFKQLIILSLDEQGKIYYQIKGEKFKTINVEIEEINKEYNLVVDLTTEFQKEFEQNNK